MTTSFDRRIVITGVGLVSPNADNPADFRRKLLLGISEIQEIDLRYFGKTAAGICTFDETKHRKKKENNRGTRAGCIGAYCAHEALMDADLAISAYDPARIGVYIGLTEHGTVETDAGTFTGFVHQGDVSERRDVRLSGQGVRENYTAAEAAALRQKIRTRSTRLSQVQHPRIYASAAPRLPPKTKWR